MKRTLFLFLAMAVATLSGAAAQSPPPTAAPSCPQVSHITAIPPQIAQKSAGGFMAGTAQYRTATLAALTPQHRALLGTLAAQLTVADQPDLDGATAQLVAQLTPAEEKALRVAFSAYLRETAAAVVKVAPNMAKQVDQLNIEAQARALSHSDLARSAILTTMNMAALPGSVHTWSSSP